MAPGSHLQRRATPPPPTSGDAPRRRPPTSDDAPRPQPPTSGGPPCSPPPTSGDAPWLHLRRGGPPGEGGASATTTSAPSCSSMPHDGHLCRPGIPDACIQEQEETRFMFSCSLHIHDRLGDTSSFYKFCWNLIMVARVAHPLLVNPASISPLR